MRGTFASKVLQEGVGIGSSLNRVSVKIEDKGGGQGNHTVNYALMKAAIFNAILNKPAKDLKENIMAVLKVFSDSDEHQKVILEAIKLHQEKKQEMHLLENREERKSATSYLSGSSIADGLRLKVVSSLKYAERAVAGELAAALGEQMMIIVNSLPGSAYTLRNSDGKYHSRAEATALGDLKVSSEILKFCTQYQSKKPAEPEAEFLADFKDAVLGGMRETKPTVSDPKTICDNIAKIANKFFGMKVSGVGKVDEDIKNLLKAVSTGFDPKSLQTDYIKSYAAATNELFDFEYIKHPSDAERRGELKMLSSLTAKLIATSFQAYDPPLELRDKIALAVCEEIIGKAGDSQGKIDYGEKKQGWGECFADKANNTKLDAATLRDVVKANYLTPDYKMKQPEAPAKSFVDMIKDARAKPAASAALTAS